MNEQIRADFERVAMALGYNVEHHPIHSDMYLFSVTNDAYRLYQDAHARYAGCYSALDHELSSIQSTVESYNTPSDALKELIDWHVEVALDPKTNGGKVLVDVGYAGSTPIAVVSGYHGGHCTVTPTDPAAVLRQGMPLYAGGYAGSGEAYATAGMNLGERIAYVGGRENEQGYVEFGSPMAVKALIDHVLRDIASPPAQPKVPDREALIELLTATSKQSEGVTADLIIAMLSAQENNK